MPNLTDISGSRQPIEFAFEQWVPDVPAFRNPGFPNCENLIPGDAGQYRPFPAVQTISDNSITDLVTGVTQNVGQLFGAKSSSTGRFYYTACLDPVADTMHFFQFDESTDLWEDVTPLTPQGFLSNDHAFFDVFGTRIYTASSVNQRIMAKDIAAGGNFAEITDAPSARDLVVTRGFLMAIHHRIGEGSDIIRDGVTWSGANNPENWPDVSTDPIGALSVLRGRTQLVGGGELKRIIAGINGADAIIFGETKIWRVTFIGAPSVWDFQIISHDDGTSVPTSVVSASEFIYFLGRRGWMRTDGASVEPVGAGVVNRSFLFGDTLDGRFQLDAAALTTVNLGIRAGVSAEPMTDRLAMWSYQTTSDSTLFNLATSTGDTLITSEGDNILAVGSSTTTNDTILMINERTGAWGNAKIQLHAMGRVETNRTRTDAARWVGLDASFDLVALSSSTYLDAYVETSEHIGAANNRVTVRRAWPFVDSENCEISLLYRERLHGAQSQTALRTMEDDSAIPIKQSGRFVSVRLDLPGSDDWTALIGMSVEFSDQGLGGGR